MSLEPFFSVSPRHPVAVTYDPADRSAPYATAGIRTFGGITIAAEYLPDNASLDYQYVNDQILLAYQEARETDQTITSLRDISRYSAVWLSFSCNNIPAASQYLLMFRLAKMGASRPTAQFFVGTRMVHAETLTRSPYDDIAILLDDPGLSPVHVLVRLAAPLGGGAFYFKGINCYLL